MHAMCLPNSNSQRSRRSNVNIFIVASINVIFVSANVQIQGSFDLWMFFSCSNSIQGFSIFKIVPL